MVDKDGTNGVDILVLAAWVAMVVAWRRYGRSGGGLVDEVGLALLTLG